MKLVLLACHAVVLTATFIGSAAAQTEVRTTTFYRCGADGRELRDSPCPSGPKPGDRANGTPVEFDHPSAAQTRAASERAIADAKRAHTLEARRKQDEIDAHRQASRAVGINGLATPAAAAKPAAKPASAPKPPVSPKAPKLAKPHAPAKVASAPR